MDGMHIYLAITKETVRRFYIRPATARIRNGSLKKKSLSRDFRFTLLTEIIFNYTVIIQLRWVFIQKEE